MKLPVKYNTLKPAEKRLVREEYIKRQKGLCHYCKKPLDGPASDEVMAKSINEKLFPIGFFNYPIHLYHSHEDGMTIGAIYCHCNAILWQYYGE